MNDLLVHAFRNWGRICASVMWRLVQGSLRGVGCDGYCRGVMGLL